MKRFEETQKEFVLHIRDPEHSGKLEDIEDRRLKIYRELFFNNILGFLSSGFPVLESIYGEEKWRKLARQFFIHHHCRSPYFVDISKEFVEFLSNEYELHSDDPAFLLELAHYEWLELDISIKKTQQNAKPWDKNDKFSHVCLSETAVLASYQFPVHQISLDYQPNEKTTPIYIVVYRDSDFEVGFTVVNDVTAHLINVLANHTIVSIDDIINHMIASLPQIAAEQVASGTKETIEVLLNQQILLIPSD